MMGQVLGVAFWPIILVGTFMLTSRGVRAERKRAKARARADVVWASDPTGKRAAERAANPPPPPSPPAQPAKNDDLLLGLIAGWFFFGHHK